MASFDMAGDAEGLMRFQADLMSVSGTSSEEYRESKDSTLMKLALLFEFRR